jgi:hypothetical protein
VSNLETALAWAKLGFAVHPCYSVDTWKGSNLHEAKTPLIHDWPNKASKEPSKIGALFPEGSDFLVGVIPRQDTVLLDVDIDIETGKDGFDSLEKEHLNIPDTFHVTTRRGGSHYLYKRNPTLELGPLANIVLPNKTKLVGVDRRAGGSYFIAWSNSTPKDIESLSLAPSWLVQESTTSYAAAYKGSIQDWLESLNDSELHVDVARAIRKIPKKDFGHTEMITHQAHIVRLGAEGKPGVPRAILALANEWLRGQYNTPKYEQDFIASLAGAIVKFGAPKATPSPETSGAAESPEQSSSVVADSDLDSLVQEMYLREKALIAAKRRIADESFTGSQVISWEELEAAEQDFIVEDFISAESLNFLVAKRNLGKTFLLVDLICHMAFGLPWLGKATQQVPIVFVLGEGKPGMFQRIRSWCTANGKDIEVVKKWITWVNGARLMSDISIERVEAAVRWSSAKLLIFDTWSATSGVENENDAAQTAEIISRLALLSPKPAILFSHHPTKASQDTENLVMRGSGTLEGSADVVMVMYRDRTGKLPSGMAQRDLIALSTDSEHGGKNRNSQTETIRGLYLEPVEPKSKVMKHIGSDVMSHKTSKLLDILTRPMTVKELVLTSDLKDASCRRALAIAMAEGFVEKTKSLVANQGYVYSRVELTEASIEPHWSNILEDVQDMKDSRNKKKVNR